MPEAIVTLPVPAQASYFLLARTGKLAAAVCGDNRLRVWSLPDAKLLRTIGLSKVDMDMATISSDGRWILTGDHAGAVTVWDSGSGAAYFQLRLPPYPSTAAFSPDGKYLALAAMGAAVQVFNVATRRKLFDLENPVGGNSAVAFSRDGALLAAADSDTLVRIYDARTGKLRARYNDFLVEPFAVEFTLDAEQVMAGGGDKTIALIESSTGKEIRRLERTTEPPNALCLSPDGKVLAAVYLKVENMQESGPVITWDIATGKRQKEWLPATRVIGIGWTEDGRLLAATSTKEAVTIWNV